MKFELDNFQKEAIKSLFDGLNVVVTAPTGSGKTLIAEKGIEKYIEDGKKVIYTTPIKALSNQKFNDFQNERIDTGLLTGDRSENPNANLIIATTEILRNMKNMLRIFEAQPKGKVKTTEPRTKMSPFL